MVGSVGSVGRSGRSVIARGGYFMNKLSLPEKLMCVYFSSFPNLHFRGQKYNSGTENTHDVSIQLPTSFLLNEFLEETGYVELGDIICFSSH